MVEVVVGSAYTAVAVMEVEVAEEEKAVVVKAVADRKSLAEAVEVVGEVEDRVSQAGEAVEEVEDRVSLAAVVEVVADHMDSHILSTFHIPSAFSLLYSMQQTVIAKAE